MGLPCLVYTHLRVHVGPRGVFTKNGSQTNLASQFGQCNQSVAQMEELKGEVTKIWVVHGVQDPLYIV